MTARQPASMAEQQPIATYRKCCVWRRQTHRQWMKPLMSGGVIETRNDPILMPRSLSAHRTLDWVPDGRAGPDERDLNTVVQPSAGADVRRAPRFQKEPGFMTRNIDTGRLEGLPDLYPRIRKIDSVPLESIAFDNTIAGEWVHAYDSAWLDQEWDRLRLYLAPDVEFVSPDFSSGLIGRAAVMESWRAVMSRSKIHKYDVKDLNGYRSGPVGIITYRWQLDRTIGTKRYQTRGRDLLILRSTSELWQLVWRAQLEADVPSAAVPFDADRCDLDRVPASTSEPAR